MQKHKALNLVDSVTIGDLTYKTAGNILFEKEAGSYFMAESPLLEKMDAAIQVGILENGLQTLLKKIRG